MLTLASAFAWNLFPTQIMRAALVPGTAYSPPREPAPDYAQPAAWLARPGLAADPSRWLPAGVSHAAAPQAAIFYVAPSVYYRRTSWNMPIGDRDGRRLLRQYAMSQASALTSAGPVWAPLYRQATLGALLTKSRDADAAIELAYSDVERAFAAFLAAIPPAQPIVLAGHSQGSLLLTRLLARHIAGTPVAQRIVAAYIVGWPVSVEADLPALGLAACRAPGQARCILSWQSFANPADPSQVREIFDGSPSFTGKPRKGTHMLCTNPLTGAPDTKAPRSANLGALVPNASQEGGVLVPGAVPAACSPAGVLLIGDAPDGFTGFVMPGGNYHMFDYALFWANVRADVQARTHALVAER
ncbi:DUF3089 domain-containing protein [Flavisphingomonas formosensis]|uniref:DUF3089 domain-containing protein n=1 Tax=Flavisphingomonas formosensis TaxID=861534 RepID=UPI0018DF0D6C|nr:DUF3089 domain-containing protein [Sphingomonas formosensis]